MWWKVTYQRASILRTVPVFERFFRVHQNTLDVEFQVAELDRTQRPDEEPAQPRAGK